MTSRGQSSIDGVFKTLLDLVNYEGKSKWRPNQVISIEDTDARYQFTNLTGQTPSQTTAQTGKAAVNDGSGNEFILLADGWVNILKLGGTSISTAVKSALATFDFVFIPEGSGYVWDSTVTLAGGKHVVTQGNSGFVVSLNAFHVTGNENSITNIGGRSVWDMNTAAVGTRWITFKTGTASTNKFHVTKHQITNSYGVLYDENHATNNITSLYVEDVLCTLAKARQVQLQDGFAFLFFDKFVIDNVGAPAYNESSFFMENYEGLTITNSDILGGNSASSSQHGMELDKGSALSIDRLLCEFLGGVGLKISNQTFVNLTNVKGANNYGAQQILLDTVNRGGAVNVLGKGRKTAADGAALSDGIKMDGVLNYNMTNIRSEDNTGNGLNIVNSQFSHCANVYTFNNTLDGTILDTSPDCTINSIESNSNVLSGLQIKNSSTCIITALRAKTNTRYGIEETGTSNFNLLGGAIFGTNTINNGIQVGAGTTTASYINNAGAYINNTTGVGAF